jgi:hypothetical protein
MVWAHVISMAPRAGRAGATAGATSQSSPTRRRSAAGAKVPQHRMPRPSRRGAPEHTRSALHSMQMHGHPLRAPQRHGETRVQLLLLDGEHRSPSWNRRATAQPRPQAKLPSATPPLPGMRPHLAAGTRVAECMGARTGEREPPATQRTKRLWLRPQRRRTRRLLKSRLK